MVPFCLSVELVGMEYGRFWMPTRVSIADSNQLHSTIAPPIDAPYRYCKQKQESKRAWRDSTTTFSFWDGLIPRVKVRRCKCANELVSWMTLDELLKTVPHAVVIACVFDQDFVFRRMVGGAEV
jgi:hypothetical protein